MAGAVAPLNNPAMATRSRGTKDSLPPLFNGHQKTPVPRLTPSFASAFKDQGQESPEDDFVLHCSQSYYRPASQALDDTMLPDISLALATSLTSQEPTTMHLSLPGLTDDLPTNEDWHGQSQPLSDCAPREVHPLAPLVIPEAMPETTPEFGPPSSCCMSDGSSNHSVPRSRTQDVFPIFKPKSERKVLAVIRHGESEYNAAAHSTKAFSDPRIFDPHLTVKGKTQSEALRGKLRKLIQKHGDPLWVVSPLTRCLETFIHACPCPDRLLAKPVAQEVAEGVATPPSCLPINLQVLSLISEHMASSGDVGRTPDKLVEEFPLLAPHLEQLQDKWWYSQPGQTNCAEQQKFMCRESNEHLHSRAEKFRAWLSQRPEKFIILVGHSTFWHTFFKQKERMRNGECLIHRCSGFRLQLVHNPVKRGKGGLG